MQEGEDNESDITDDDYRFTAELRGRNYGAPGSVTYRIIAGDGDSRDGDGGSSSNFDSSRWYFWRFTWQNRIAPAWKCGRTVRTAEPSTTRRSATGATLSSRPHFIHLGAPIGRGGALDATMPGITIKNVWASSRPAPGVPGE